MSEQDQIHKVFDNVQAHLRIADLIRRFSTNRHSVHETALEGLDLRECRRILDLGCGFGPLRTNSRAGWHLKRSLRGLT